MKAFIPITFFYTFVTDFTYSTQGVAKVYPRLKVYKKSEGK